jgi:hypothetical protein
MKKAVVALLIGLAMGYRWGYGDGTGKRPSVAARALDRFGVSKLRDAQATRERRVEDASKP